MRFDQASVAAVILFRLAVLLWGDCGEAHADVPRDWRGRGEGTEQVLDETVRHAGKASGSIRSTGAAGGFGSLSQTFRADRYRGMRLRLTAFVKSVDVNGF